MTGQNSGPQSCPHPDPRNLTWQEMGRFLWVTPLGPVPSQGALEETERGGRCCRLRLEEGVQAPQKLERQRRSLPSLQRSPPTAASVCVGSCWTCEPRNGKVTVMIVKHVVTLLQQPWGRRRNESLASHRPHAATSTCGAWLISARLERLGKRQEERPRWR